MSGATEMEGQVLEKERTLAIENKQTNKQDEESS